MDNSEAVDMENIFLLPRQLPKLSDERKHFWTLETMMSNSTYVGKRA